MKKFYILGAIALVSTTAFSQTTTVISDAESGSHPFYTWNNAHTATIADNPYPADAQNNSSKVIFFDGGAWGGLAKWSDAGDNLPANCITFQFDVLVKATDGLANGKAYFKIQCDNSVSTKATTNVKYEKGKDITETDKWITISLDISDRTISDFQQIAIQCEVGKYYIDNIKYISSSSSAINAKSNTASNYVSNPNGITILNSEGKKVAIYSTTGALISSQYINSSEFNIETGKGFFIINIDNISSKVTVK